MDRTTILEARRLLRDLIYEGRAVLSNGTVVSPDADRTLVPLIEKVAKLRAEEKDEPTSIEGFELKETYRAKKAGEES